MSGLGALVRFVSLRRITAAPIRSLLTLLGVALGVAMLVGMAAANASILGAFGELVDRASGKAALEVVQGEVGVDRDLVDVVATAPGVAHAAAVIEQTTYLDVPGAASGPGERVLVLGVDLLGDLFFLPYAHGSGEDVLADPLGFANDPRALLVGATLARERGLGPGSKLRLRTATGMQEFHVEAVLTEAGPSQAFGGRVAVLSIDAAALAFARSGRADRIDVALAEHASVDAVADALRARVAGHGTVERPSRRGEQIARMSSSFQVGLQVSSFIALLVGMFLIYNSVSIAVAERRREIGILRAVGVSRRRVLAVFLAEAVVLGTLGGALGVPLGGLLARAVVASVQPSVSRFYAAIAPPSPHVSARLALAGFVVGLAATVAAAWFPARSAAHTDPVAAMRRDIHAHAGGRVPTRWLLAASGLVALVVAWLAHLGGLLAGFVGIGLVNLAAALATPALVVLLHRVAWRAAQRWFGLPVRLGIDNVARHLGRSTLTVAALMLAAMASMTVASYRSSFMVSMSRWVEQSIPADVIITAGSTLADQHSVPFAPEMLPRLQGMEGVAYLDPVRFVTLTHRGMRIEMLALGTRNYLTRAPGIGRQVLEGAPIEPGVLADAPRVFVSENVRAKLGVHAGDTLELDTPAGPRRFEVRNVVVDYSSDQGFVLIDTRWFRDAWKDERIDGFDLYAAPGVDPEALAADARRRLSSGAAGGDSGLYVMTSRAFKTEIYSAIEQTFEVTRASELVALIVALLGVIGTMLSAVLDRVREIGVLRAIGATRRQIAVAVLAEATFLGLASALIAVVASIPCTAVFVSVVGYAATGWHVPLAFDPSAMTRFAATIVGFAALAGALPARHAARLEVPRALAWE